MTELSISLPSPGLPPTPSQAPEAEASFGYSPTSLAHRQASSFSLSSVDEKGELDYLLATRTVIIFGRSACAYTKKASEIFRQCNVRFHLINLAEAGEKMEMELVRRFSSGRERGERNRVFVFVGGQYVGGCDALAVSYATGNLWDRLLDAGVLY